MNQFQSFIMNCINILESVILKCIPMDGEEEKNPLFSLNVAALNDSECSG